MFSAAHLGEEARQGWQNWVSLVNASDVCQGRCRCAPRGTVAKERACVFHNLTGWWPFLRTEHVLEKEEGERARRKALRGVP